MAVSNIIKYKDYRAAIEFDAESECFVGNVLGIRDAIFFGGETVAELKMRFRDCIETYLEACRRDGIEPDRKYSGSFNIRISPETHKKAALEAAREHISLNQFVAKAIDAAVAEL